MKKNYSQLERFDRAIRLIDDANSADPNKETLEGKEYAKEYLYSLRMTDWLNRVYPEASEGLKLAARAQHICRWKIPRGQFDDGNIGYFEWRTALQNFHAEKAEEILKEVGYDEHIIEKVKALLRKEWASGDKELRKLEDVVCLVFLEHYFHNFSKLHDREKVVDIIRKTWKKMTPKGQEKVAEIPMVPEVKYLIDRAVYT